MTTVTAEEFQSSFKKAMFEVLSVYFDGKAHEIGDKVSEFPLTSIAFGRQLYSQLSAPSIMIETAVTQPREKKWASGSGYRIQRTGLYKMTVVTLSPDRNFRTNDATQDKLELLLNGGAAEFAARNIKVLDAGSAVEVSDKDYQVSQRYVKLRFDLAHKSN